MKSARARTRTITIFGACALLAALAFPWQARGQRAAEARQRTDVRSQPQEPVEQLPAPAERAEPLEVQEMSEQELVARPDLFKVPRECAGLKPVVETHDAADNFNPPGNPVTLSPELNAFVAGKATKGYDNPAINTWFADSFRLRNCCICYAVLQVRARHYGIDTFINDAVIAGLAPYNNPNTNFVNVLLWPGPQTKTYVLPTDRLNQYVMQDNPFPTYIDLRGQDDSDFDYARLMVWYY